jgi:hypothetical protein
MENHTKMEHKEIVEILKNYKNKSNKDLKTAMDFLHNDFEETKKLILKLVNHLDSSEKSYNKLLEEFNKRLNGK